MRQHPRTDPAVVSRQVVAGFMTVAIGCFGVWWVSAAASGSHRWFALVYVAGLAMGALVGLVVSRRDWWLGFVPLAAFSLASYLFHFRFSETRPFDDGDFTAAAIVMFVGILAGILGTIAFLITVALRGLITQILRLRARGSAETAG
jgi:hypothetical protein